MKLLDLNEIENFVILDNFNSPSNNQILFTNPIEIISTTDLSEIEEIFSKIEYFLNNNFYVVGYKKEI